MKKSLILPVVFLTQTPAAEAQFLKNLKKKVEQKVGDAVANNIADKAANEADKSLNVLSEKELKNSSVSNGSERVEPSEILASYNFDWKYTLKKSASHDKNLRLSGYQRKSFAFRSLNYHPFEPMLCFGYSFI